MAKDKGKKKVRGGHVEPVIHKKKTERVNYEDYRGTIVGWALIQAMTAKYPNNPEFSDFLDRANFGEKNRCFKVSLLINGEEFPFAETMEFWESQVEGMIAKKAEKLIEERVSDVSNTLSSLLEIIESQAKRRLHDPDAVDED